MTASVEGGNVYADMIDLKPARSVVANAQLCDESLFASYYRAWAERMAEVVA
jgi:benzoate/toluate 1,2-dioxygenase alpha subunit